MLSEFFGTDFVYNIVEDLLTGSLDGVTFSASAGSGGRAGSKLKGVVNPLLANNPYATGIKSEGNRAGGPIVMGKYTMKTHESRKFWIRLIPDAGNNMKGRDGFAIHGRGPIGSHGCIVPTDFNVVEALYKLIAAREMKGGPAPTLAVVAIGDFDFVDQKLAKLKSTA